MVESNQKKYSTPVITKKKSAPNVKNNKHPLTKRLV